VNRLEGKVAVITGAGSGVGRASALRFAAEGAAVVVADVRDDWAAGTVELVTDAGGRAVAAHCDVTVEQDVAGAIDVAVGTYGRLDVMFNNAGITGFTPGRGFEDQTVEDFERLVSVNYRGVFLGCKHAVRRFRAQGGGGVILNTGSIAGMVGWGSVVYGSTKGGVNQLTRGVAIEVAKYGIRCNAICPAAMPATNFIVGPGGEFAEPDRDYVSFVASMHPLGRAITAEDCAAAAVFLCSDDAANITGVLLPIDGGFTAQ
jgi:NAD(P)-dependent dehydrogenase (short-subunit alcohol dehydrogenase family)